MWLRRWHCILTCYSSPFFTISVLLLVHFPFVFCLLGWLLSLRLSLFGSRAFLTQIQTRAFLTQIQTRAFLTQIQTRE
ncbi:hypothetical protein NC651_006205 [Populus alba x Populus x berolinensis]|nr:hypothetical protein NC651_006205 [Populus alba x Populus x berolinensis]